MSVFMVFNATFDNISVISWQSVLLVEETGVPGENHRPVTSYWETYRYTFPWIGFELTTLVVIGTDCTGSCKSNYHTITTMNNENLTNNKSFCWNLFQPWYSRKLGHLVLNNIHSLMRIISLCYTINDFSF